LTQRNWERLEAKGRLLSKAPSCLSSNSSKLYARWRLHFLPKSSPSQEQLFLQRKGQNRTAWVLGELSQAFLTSFFDPEIRQNTMRGWLTWSNAINLCFLYSILLR
jgi:hypothetical protein